jgi:SAM-dependent methyltransferase
VPDITTFYSTHPERPFRYGYPLNYFDITQNALNILRAYKIKPGYKVAEIGAASGWTLGFLSMYTDSVSYFAQDIDTNFLNQTQLVNMVAHFSAQKMSTQTNTFDCVIGTPTQTNLPNESFDIILINNTYHEFSDKDAMIKDIKKKLKPEGRLIISELIANDYFVFKHEGCNIQAESLNDLLSLMNKNGLYLTNTWLPEGNVYNHLTFELNQQKSEEFLANKPNFDLLLQLSNKKVLKDQEQLDSLATQLKSLKSDLEDYYDEEAICDYFYYLGDALIENNSNDLAKSVFYVGSKMYPEYAYFYEAQCYANQLDRKVDDQLLKLINRALDESRNSFYYLDKVALNCFKSNILLLEDDYYNAFESLISALIEIEELIPEIPDSAVNVQKAIVYGELYNLLIQDVDMNVDVDIMNMENNSPLEAISMAIAFDPLNPDYYLDRVTLHYNNGEYDKALSDLDRLIYLTPFSYNYYVLRAKVKKKLGDKSGQKEDMEQYRFMKWRYKHNYL